MDSQDIDEGENAQVMETEHGLGYDCPFIENHSRLVRVLAGASLTAAECLKEGANIAINWCVGARHVRHV